MSSFFYYLFNDALGIETIIYGLLIEYLIEAGELVE
jgi:hypothetical protein